MESLFLSCKENYTSHSLSGVQVGKEGVSSAKEVMGRRR